MKRHIVIQGERGSGKSHLANMLARILFHDEDVQHFTFNKEASSLSAYTAAVNAGKQLLIIDGCPTPGAIMLLANFLDGWKAEHPGNDFQVIFISQVNCSALDSRRFRVNECRYSASREEYVTEPLTLKN